jgi:hypothetical protein
MTDEGDFSPGDVVIDRDDETPNPAVVVNCVPGATADEWNVPGEQTLAEANPDYPADASVVVVVFEDDFDYDALAWNRDEPIALTEVNDSPMKYYSFPAPRLVQDAECIPTLTDIQHVGDGRAEELRAEGYESVAEVAAADQSELANVDGIGESRAADIAASATDLLDNQETDAPDETETDAAQDRETPDDDTDTSTDLSGAIVALSRYLDTDGMDTAIADDGQSVHVTNAKHSYRVSLASGVEGDGPHRSQLEEAVEKVRAATEATNE